MRNWFWLRSSHPFSLFTILHPTFSSTSQNSLVSFCTLSARYLWLLILNVKPCCWCTSMLKEPPPPPFCTSRPQPSTPATTACLAPPSLRLPCHCSTFNSCPSWLSSTGMTFPLQSGQLRYLLLFWNRAENASLWEILSPQAPPESYLPLLLYVFLKSAEETDLFSVIWRASGQDAQTDTPFT